MVSGPPKFDCTVALNMQVTMRIEGVSYCAYKEFAHIRWVAVTVKASQDIRGTGALW